MKKRKTDGRRTDELVVVSLLLKTTGAAPGLGPAGDCWPCPPVRRRDGSANARPSPLGRTLFTARALPPHRGRSTESASDAEEPATTSLAAPKYTFSDL